MRYWVNGIETDHISCLNRGLAYGDGVFETILCHQKTALLWDAHKKRLLDGCLRLGIVCQDLDDKVLPLLKDIQSGYSVLKLIVCRDGNGAGYLPSDDKPVVIVIIRDYTPQKIEPLSVGLSDISLNCSEHTAGIKHLSRLEQVLAARQARVLGYDELLMFNTKKHLVEAISSNVFLYIGGRWLTPALNESGVEGVMRQYCLDSVFPAIDMHCEQAVLTKGDLDRCDAAFLTNSIKGVVPIKSIHGQPLSVGICLPLINRASQYFNA